MQDQGQDIDLIGYGFAMGGTLLTGKNVFKHFERCTSFKFGYHYNGTFFSSVQLCLHEKASGGPFLRPHFRIFSHVCHCKCDNRPTCGRIQASQNSGRLGKIDIYECILGLLY